MLHINQHVLDLITAHAQKGLPHEVCGYLAEKDGKISTHYELTNIDGAADHFSMSPKEQFAAVKDMRQKGLSLKAVYHSHPATPARMSDEDIRLAYDSNCSYVIVSLLGGDVDIKSFRVKDGVVNEEDLEVI